MKCSWLTHDGQTIRARGIVAAAALFVASSCVVPGSGIDKGLAGNPGEDQQGGHDGDSSNGDGGLGFCISDSQFERTLTPFDIRDGKNTYFNYQDLNFIADPRIFIDSIEFELILEGGLKGEDGEVKLSLNGYQGWGNSYEPFYSVDDDYGDDGEHSRCRFDFVKMALNGGMSVRDLMKQVFVHQGELRISANGKGGRGSKIVAAEIEVKGRYKVPCPSPAPSDSPSPIPSLIPPQTTIVSVDPEGVLVRSRNMSIEFTSDQVNVNYACTLDGASSACASPQLYSNLSNGPHQFTVAATNSAGLTDPEPAVYEWSVWAPPPSVIITNLSSLPSLTNSGSISIEFMSNKAKRFRCSIDGGYPIPCTSPVTYAGLPEGKHVVTIYGFRKHGRHLRRLKGPASFQWIIDQTPPQTRFVSVTDPDTITNDSTKTFEFGADKPSTFECSIDQQGFSPCQSPFSLTDLAEGDHSFEVRATDLAGNVGDTASFLWTVDLSPPTIALGQVTPPAGVTNARSVAVEFSADKPATFTCSLDSDDAVDCTSPYQASITTEGSHTVTIVAEDMAGNVSDPVTVGWTMDFTAPTLSWGNFVPSAATYINSTSLSAEVISSKPSTLSCKLNDIDLNQTASPVSVSNLAEGPYTLSVTGTDQAGNVSPAITHFFIVDVTPPVTTLTATHSGDRTTDTTNTLTFSVNKQASFECNFDGAGFKACQSPVALSGVAEGIHTFQVHAIDLAGNLGQAVTVTWTVDRSSPVTSAQMTQTGSNSFRFDLSANKPVSGFSCSLDGASFSSCSASVTYTNLATGAHSFTARAIDTFGNMDPIGATIQFTASDPIRSSITGVTPSTTPTNQTTITFTFTNNHPAATVFFCSLDGTPDATCTSPKTYNGLLAGNHSFRVRAQDEFGQIESTGTSYAWAVDLTPPVTTLNSNRTSNTNISFSFSADKATARFECSLDSVAFSTCGSPVSLSVATVGAHSFTARAVDLAGNVGQPAVPVNWTVNPPISTTINTAGLPILTNQTSISISFSSNLASATFQCSWDGGAFQACASPASKSGLADGSHTFQVQAVDPWGAADPTGASYSWTVDTVAPVVLNNGPALSPTRISIVVTWTLSKPATGGVAWGIGTSTGNTIPDDGVMATSHSVTIGGLIPNTVYSVIVTGHDAAGNAYTSVRKQIRTNP